MCPNLLIAFPHARIKAILLLDDVVTGRAHPDTASGRWRLALATLLGLSRDAGAKHNGDQDTNIWCAHIYLPPPSGIEIWNVPSFNSKTNSHTVFFHHNRLRSTASRLRRITIPRRRKSASARPASRL